MSLITIKGSKITAVISTLGAEVQSLKDENGVERLWQRDPAFWTGCAPILFPVAGGFRDDCYELDGQRYPMPKHGFAKKKEWQVEETAENKAVFLLQEKDPGFPFDYDLRAIFTAEENHLSIAFAISSRDEKPFYFSIGSHEAYATPEGIEDYEIVFDEEEKLEDYVLDGNLILRQPKIMAEKAKSLPLKYEYFAVDALVFRTLKSRGVTLRGGKAGHTVRVDFPEHDVLMFWTKPGANYICIEPWCNAPDFVDADHRIDHKPGFMRLEKGQTITRRHTITLG